MTKPKKTREAQPQIFLKIPPSTFVQIVFVAGLVVLAIKLSSLLMLCFLAILLAVTLHPLLVFLQGYLPRNVAFIVLTLVLMGAGALVVSMLVPPLVEQLGNLVKDFPQTRAAILEKLPPDGMLRRRVTRLFNGEGLPDASAAAQHILTVGQLAAEGLSEIFLIAILALYFLIDGPRAMKWGVDFFSEENRAKMRQTADETSKVVFAYVAGQAITSLLASIFVFAVLSVLKVPAALTLAVMAGVFDVLPILGFFLSVTPALLLALTVSPFAAVAVVISYVVYHAIENYIIVPKVYGDRLQVSTLVVLLALSAAGLVAGIWGAVAILPVVASYPIVERIWLRESLGDEVVHKHRT